MKDLFKELGSQAEEKNNNSYFDEHHKKQIEKGFITEDGTPLKCECGCEDFKQVNRYYGVGCIEEYSLQCENENCKKIVGHWAYGNWIV